MLKNFIKYSLFVVVITIVFGVFPKNIVPHAKAANRYVIYCNSTDDYTGIKDGKCDNAKNLLFPRWDQPALEVKDYNATQKKVIIKWKSAQIFDYIKDNPDSSMLINFKNYPAIIRDALRAIPFIGSKAEEVFGALYTIDTSWSFNRYILTVKGPSGNSYDYPLSGTATTGNAQQAEYVATIEGKGAQNFEFTIKAEYKFRTILCSDNSVIDWLCKNSGALSMVANIINNTILKATNGAITVPNDPRTVDIQTNTAGNNSLQPIIVGGSGSYDQTSKIGTAQFSFNASQMVKDGKAEVQSYDIYYRTVQGTTNGNMVKVTNMDTIDVKCKDNCGAVDKKAVANMEPSQVIKREYFIKANYKSGDSNAGYSNGWNIIFTSDANGNVTATTEQSTTTQPDPTTFNQSSSGGGVQNDPTTKGACEKGCDAFNFDPIRQNVCKMMCWVQDGVNSILTWAFDVFKSAVSTNSSQGFQPFTSSDSSITTGPTTGTTGGTTTAPSTEAPTIGPSAGNLDTNIPG